MKIKEIIIKQNFTKFRDNQSLILENEKSNSTFIYGVNGTGKSSISRLFYYSNLKLANSEEFNDRIEQLTTIGTTKNAEVKILFDDNSETNILNKDILNPHKIPVFNKDYIDDKITYQQNFRNNKFDPKNSTYSITSEAKKNYINKKKEYDSIIEQGKNIRNEIETIINSEIIQIVSDCGTTKNNNIFNDYTYDNFRKFIANDINNDIEQKRLEHIQFIQNLKGLSENNKIDFNIPLINSDEMLNDLIDKVNSVIKFSEDKTKISFAKEYLDNFDRDEKNWKINGEKYIKDSICPFCGNNISDNEIIKIYHTYISSKIKETEDFINNKLKDIENYKNIFLSNSNIISQKLIILDKLFSENNNDTFNNFKNLFQEFINKITHVLKSKLSDDNLYKDCTGIISEISEREKQDFINEYKKLKSVIDVINKKVDDSSKEKKKRNEVYLKTTAKYIVYKKAENKFIEISSLHEKISIISKELEILKKIYEEDMKNKNELLKIMNQFLDDFKITNYRINDEFDLCINDIPVTYKANKYLSDGEKSIIAFALFMSELSLLYTSSEKDIIFIDDPIASMDYPNIYNIYNYIYDLIKENNNSQIILTSHNIKFLNMFKMNFKNSQYILFKENENGKTIILNDDNKLGSNYLEKLKEIYKIYSENNISNNQKLYIHNYCRYVIETLSRFEFPNHNSDSDSSKHYIDELLKKISEGKIEYKISENSIKSVYNIINKGSHATIDIVHDDEEYDDLEYINCCAVIIKYLKIAYTGQYEYLSTNYNNIKKNN